MPNEVSLSWYLFTSERKNILNFFNFEQLSVNNLLDDPELNHKNQYFDLLDHLYLVAPEDFDEGPSCFDPKMDF